MRRRSVLALTAGLAFVSAARAAVIVEPNWLRRPTAEQLLAFWPSAAMVAGRGGTATLRCRVNSAGALRDCQVEREAPAGYGFGVAAVAMTSQLAMRPQTVDGRPTDGGFVVIPFKWDASAGVGLGDAVKVLTRPPWTAAPTRSDVAAVLPAAARRGVDGRAVLQCDVTAAGTLRACHSGQEIPTNAGFAAAAMRLVPRFRVATTLGDGRSSAGSQVTFAVSLPAELARPGAAALAPTLQHSPEWRRLPGTDGVPIIPADARRAGVLVGHALVACRVGDGGALEHCVVTSENPTGYGFGAHALALASGFALFVWTAEGTPTVGASLTLPLTFRDPPASQTVATPQAEPATSGAGRR